MNVWLLLITLVFICIAGISIYIKHRKFRYIVWNCILFVISSIAFWIGGSSKELYLVLICSFVIGGSLLLSVLHAYNKLISSSKYYESIGENRKQRSFGNGYWK